MSTYRGKIWGRIGSQYAGFDFIIKKLPIRQMKKKNDEVERRARRSCQGFQAGQERRRLKKKKGFLRVCLRSSWKRDPRSVGRIQSRWTLQIQGRLERRADSRMKEDTLVERNEFPLATCPPGWQNTTWAKTDLVTNEKNKKIRWSKWWYLMWRRLFRNEHVALV